jgi:thymidylate synthase (FAD)
MKTSAIVVDLIGAYGDDLLVANCARVSFNKWKDEFDDSGEKGSDDRLIAYLARENHFVPFCHPSATFRIKAPIFVARQLVKHQVGLSWSEVSRRYVTFEPEFWFPEFWRSRPEGSIKQGSGASIVTQMVDENGVPIDPDNVFTAAANHANTVYKWAIESGVAPEQARMILPQNMMTEWVWSGSLAAWARVCNLRLDAHSQEETRQVAQMISDHMTELFPVSWAVLLKNEANA